MPVVKFHAKTWKTLPALDGRRTDYRDETEPGFFLRVSPSGARSFGIVYRRPDGSLVRHTLGNARRVDLAPARDAAQEALARTELGADPHAEKVAARTRPGDATVADLVEAFLKSRESERWRPATRDQFERLLQNEVVPVLGSRRPAEVTRGMVRELVEAIADGKNRERGPAPVLANRVLQVARIAWNWALAKEKVDASPFVGLKLPTEEKPRDIEYSDDDLRAINAALAEVDDDVSDLVRLLLLTGARLDEVQGMAWSEIDFNAKEWRLPPERSKIGRKKPRARIIPLVDDAIAILRARKDGAKVVDIARAAFVFPAHRGKGHMLRPTKILTKIKKASGVEDFMPHGIRHTVRAKLARLGVAPHVAEMVLGHALRGMEGVYVSTGVSFIGEQRAALELWSAELSRILAGAPGAVEVQA
jgi:integrase